MMEGVFSGVNEHRVWRAADNCRPVRADVSCCATTVELELELRGENGLQHEEYNNHEYLSSLDHDTAVS